jgi:hypothetical protein
MATEGRVLAGAACPARSIAPRALLPCGGARCLSVDAAPGGLCPVAEPASGRQAIHGQTAFIGADSAARPDAVARKRLATYFETTAKPSRPSILMSTAECGRDGSLRKLVSTAASGRPDVLVWPAHGRRRHLLRSTASLWQCTRLRLGFHTIRARDDIRHVAMKTAWPAGD